MPITTSFKSAFAQARSGAPVSLSLTRYIQSRILSLAGSIRSVSRPVLGSPVSRSALALFPSVLFCPFCFPIVTALFPCTCSDPAMSSSLFSTVLSPLCPYSVSTLLSPSLFPYLLSQQLSHVLQRRISLLKFSQHLWGQVSTCVHRGQ